MKTTSLKSGVGMSKTITYGQKQKNPLNSCLNTKKPLFFKKEKRTNKGFRHKITNAISQSKVLNPSKPLKIAKIQRKTTKKPTFRSITSIKGKLNNTLYIKYLENIIKILIKER